MDCVSGVVLVDVLVQAAVNLDLNPRPDPSKDTKN